MTTTREASSQSFECPLMNRTVTIHTVYTVLSHGGIVKARAPFSTECSFQERCSIAKHSGNAISFEWGNCSYVKAKNGPQA